MLAQFGQWLEDKGVKKRIVQLLEDGKGDDLKLQHGNQEFLFDSEDGFCHPRSLEPKDKKHSFGTRAALCEYLDEQPNGTADKAVVLVSSKGIDVFLDENNIDRRDHLTVPFFHADMPPNGLMSYDDFLTYLDQQSSFIDDEENLRMQLKSVQVVSQNGAKVIDQGASIRVEAKSSEDVQGEGSASLPKCITFNLRIGTREYVIPHKFRLKIDTSLRFKLTQIDRDGAVEKFMDTCIGDIKAALPGWRVYEGPCVGNL